MRVGAGFCVGPFLDGEAVAAAARGGGVRVVDLEPGLGDRVQEVDGRALEVRRAEGVDDHGHAVLLDHLVALRWAGIEAEAVLEAGAPAALNRNAEDAHLAVRLLREERPNLLRRDGRQGDERRRLLDSGHIRIVATSSTGYDFVTPETRFVYGFAPLFVRRTKAW